MSESVLKKYNLSHKYLEKIFSNQLKEYKYNELVEYTDNFKHIIGEGAYGCVYKGKIKNLNIAVKKYNSTSIEPFLRELMSILRCRHPNIVSIYGICYEQEVCLVLEYMPRGSFQDYIDKKDGCIKLDKLKLLDAFVELSDTLAYLHAEQFLHRDIKPGNILFDEYGKAKFADFNHAVFYDDNESAHLNSITTGTSVYRDPSLVEYNESGYFLDMYSFGITLLVVLSEGKNVYGIYGRADGIYQSRDSEAIKNFFKKDWDEKTAMGLLKCAMECTRRNRRDRIEASDLARTLRIYRDEIAKNTSDIEELTRENKKLNMEKITIYQQYQEIEQKYIDLNQDHSKLKDIVEIQEGNIKKYKNEIEIQEGNIKEYKNEIEIQEGDIKRHIKMKLKYKREILKDI